MAIDMIGSGLPVYDGLGKQLGALLMIRQFSCLPVIALSGLFGIIAHHVAPSTSVN
jgi:hypothetical protein